jgi:hypothetical protein
VIGMRIFKLELRYRCVVCRSAECVVIHSYYVTRMPVITADC